MSIFAILWALSPLFYGESVYRVTTVHTCAWSPSSAFSFNEILLNCSNWNPKAAYIFQISDGRLILPISLESTTHAAYCVTTDLRSAPLKRGPIKGMVRHKNTIKRIEESFPSIHSMKRNLASLMFSVGKHRQQLLSRALCRIYAQRLPAMLGRLQKLTGYQASSFPKLPSDPFLSAWRPLRLIARPLESSSVFTSQECTLFLPIHTREELH